MTTATIINKSSGTAPTPPNKAGAGLRRKPRTIVINRWKATSAPIKNSFIRVHCPAEILSTEVVAAAEKILFESSEVVEVPITVDIHTEEAIAALRQIAIGASDVAETAESDEAAVDADTTDAQNEKMVLDALNDPRWDFRTMDGICRSTGLARSTVERVLSANKSMVRTALVPNSFGEPIYTRANKPISLRERIALARLLLTKSLN